MDFNLSTCKMIIATHADADHIQGLARARELLKTKVAAHPAERRAARDRRRDHDLRHHQGPGLRDPDAAVQDRPDAQRGRRDHGRRPEARRSGTRPATRRASSASRWATSSSAATTSTRTAASASSTPTTARTFPTSSSRCKRILRRRRRVPAAQPRPGLPPRQPHPAEGDRPADAVPVHGRLRHLRP